MKALLFFCPLSPGWPVAGRAQVPALPIIAVLGGAGNDADGQARVRAFSQALQSFGRIDGRNVTLDVRLMGDDLVRIRAAAAVGKKATIFKWNIAGVLAIPIVP
jgi:hypothetical protein